jgi:hypothetical protein
MRHRLQQILKIVWSFLVSFFSYLRADVKEFIGFIAPKDNTEKEGTGRQFQPPVVSEVVPSPPPDEKAKKTVHIYTPWWKTLAELIGVAAIVWYTVETHRGITNVQENFAKDQRPYIWQSGIEPRPIEVNNAIRVNMYFTNYGKSPAIRTRINRKALYGKDALKQADDWFVSMRSKGIPYASESIVPPGIPSDLKNAPLWTTIRSDFLLGPDDVAYIAHTDQSVVIAAHVEYFDTAGTFYYSDVCFFHLSTGVYASCEKHNEIK